MPIYPERVSAAQFCEDMNVKTNKGELNNYMSHVSNRYYQYSKSGEDVTSDIFLAFNIIKLFSNIRANEGPDTKMAHLYNLEAKNCT